MKTKLPKKLLLTLLLVILTSIFCTDWDLETDEDDLPAAVSLEIISVADTTVTLRWTQSQDVDFQSYKVYYSTSDIVDTTDKIADTLSFSYDTVKTVRPLDPNKHYYFRVIVSTYRNLISASNIVDTTTLKSFTDLKLELLQPDTLDIGESSVNLQWKKNWIEGVTRYFVYMDTAASVDSLDTLIATIYDGEATTIEGLQRQKDYWFRVFLDRNGIPSAGSNVIKITTTSGVPKPVTLDSIADEKIKDTSITISWSKSKDADFLRYIVYYDSIAAVDTFTTYSSLDTMSKRIRFTTDTAIEISPLKRDTTYWFAVYVQDSTGFIKSSNKMSAKTKDGKPTGVTLYIDSTNDTSAFVRWTMNTDDDFYRYVVYYNDTLNIDTITKIDTTDVRIGAKKYLKGDTTATVLPLDRNKKYWFVVYVEDMTGFITKSNVDTGVTDDGYPMPVELNRKSVSNTSITLEWTMNNDPDFDCYQIYMNDSSAIDTISNFIDTMVIGNRNTTTLLIDTLRDQVQYSFLIYVKNKSNYRSGSNVIYNFWVILKVDSTKISHTTIGFQWSTSLNTNDIFKSYQLYRSENINVSNNNPNDFVERFPYIDKLNYTDTTLDSSGVYYYKLYDYFLNENGNVVSEGSNVIKRDP